MSSKDLLEKYQDLTGEDLGHRPSVLEKTKFEYAPLGMPFSKAFEKDKAKSGTISESDFNYDSIHKFYEFYKKYGEFEEISLGSKYKKINSFKKTQKKQKHKRKKNKLLKMSTSFTKSITMLIKMIMTRIMK